MKPPPKLTLSQWADEKRFLSAENAAEPGRWKTKRMLPLRGIMDAISDPAVPVVAVEKGAQLGWTEAVNNAIGYFIDQDPTSILVIQPTTTNAEDWSKERLAPMLRDTPCLKGKVKDPKSRDSENTILTKSFPGGHLAIAGANSPNGLASRPRRVIVADEVDKYPVSAGKFGDPIGLARSRQNTFWNEKTLIGSTPGEKRTSTVHRWFLRGDQRRFFVPCPHCEHAQVLRWEQVHWEKTLSEEGHKVHHPDTAAYACEACGCLWSDAERWRAIASAEDQGWGWVATAEFRGVASFHLPGFLSSWLTLEKIVSEFLDAKKYGPLLRKWVNEVKGEPWEERGDAVDADALSSRLEAYDEETLPAGVMLVTVGVDTQDDRLEATFVGWGEGEESWVIGHELFLGDPGQLEVWLRMDERLKTARFETEDGRSLRVRAGCVDSGGHHGGMVLGFCRARASRRIYATKGLPNDHRGSKPIWAKALLNTKNAGDRLWGVGVDTAKDDLAARLRIIPREEPTPRAVHFPMVGLPAGYFEQLTAEQVVTELNAEGRPVRRWKMKPGIERNEALDCFILAEAAMLSLGLRLNRGPVRSSVPVGPVEEADVVEEEGADPAGVVAEVEAAPAANAPRRTRARWGAYR